MMLAFEFSTRCASLALLDGGQVVDEETWMEPQARHLLWNQALQRLLARTGTALPTITEYAVGRGPGAFSGIRIAVTAAQALALPGARPVHALSSGEALAAQIFDAHAADRVGVIGDARRGAFWFHAFQRGAPPASAWRLVRQEELKPLLQSVDLVATPEWERIGPALEASDANLVRRSLFPRARDVGRLVRDRLALGETMEPVAPLYMHPPV